VNQIRSETGYGKFITGTIDWISQLLAYPEIKYDNFLLIGHYICKAYPVFKITMKK
jgi:hypothetical protein